MQIKPPKKILAKLKQLGGLKKASVAVGFPQGYNAYPDGTSVGLVANVQEFGSSANNIPPRPFFRNTLIQNFNYKKLRFNVAKKISKGEINTSTGLNMIGGMVANDIKESIVSISSPALSPQTIINKKSSNPLVDTGHLKESVTYKVDI